MANDRIKKEISMSRYAENTIVPSDKTRSEIEKTLTRYGATGFGYMWQGTVAVIIFELQHRRIRFLLPLPDRSQFAYTPSRRYQRTAEQISEAYEQAVRQKWRALLLVIKAKLEAVESGITTIEQEFLAHIVLANNQTVDEWLSPQLDEIYQSGRMPPLLPAPRRE
jgi:hypothetical protein